MGWLFASLFSYHKKRKKRGNGCRKNHSRSVCILEVRDFAIWSANVLSDSELVCRVRSGDLESFGVLSRRYERTVLAVAWAELRDLHTAEDVAQATLILAFQHLAALKEPSSFGPWLMQIARRQVTDAARACRSTVAVLGHLSLESVVDDKPAAAWIDHEQVLQLINRLPDHERVLVGLRYFDGHTMAEIAEITARPVGTVTKQLSRSLSRLRSFFEKESLR